MKLESPKWSGIALAFRPAAKAESAADPEAVADTPQLKRLRALQEGLQRLRALPGPEASAKQAAREKVGWLKQRLEALKMMLLHASPEQAKALAQELKSIAKALSSAGQSLGAGAGEGGTPSSAAGAATDGAATDGAATDSAAADGAASADAATDGAATADAAADGAATDGATAALAAAEGEAAPETGGDKDAAAVDGGDPRAAADSDEQALRALLRDARKLLREVVGLLRPKLAAADKEAKLDLHAAEKSLADLDQRLAQGSGDDFYTAQGDLDPRVAAGGIPASPALSGVNIDLSV